MKVIAGTLAHRVIKTPAGQTTRPVTDKVKAAIFSALSERVKGARVLDLYAGSGALAIEALSRGAAEVDFVEKSKLACAIIRQNIQQLGLENVSRIHLSSVEKFMQDCLTQNTFDLIFFDPPYVDFDLTLVEKLQNLLQYSGLLIVSCSSKTDLSREIGSLALVQKKIYGDTQIGYYKISD